MNHIKIRRKWTGSTVLEKLRSSASLSPRFIQIHNPSLYGAAVRHFGSWKTAVEAAGYTYDELFTRKNPGYWNNMRIITEIKTLSAKNSYYARRNYQSLYSAALRLFGGWEIAVKAAGFDYNKIRKDWIPIDEERLRFRKPCEGKPWINELKA